MNNDRRKEINELATKAADVLADLEAILEEEQEYFDNMPEAFQGADRGQVAEAAISNLESAIDSLQEALGAMEQAAE